MRVLLTGAFGNLGSLVVAQLLERGHHVVAFDVPSKANRKVARGIGDDAKLEIAWGDIRDAARVASLVRRVDAVIHLAAIIPPFSDRNPERAREVNVGGTENILRAIETATHPPLMVFGSSISVYGPREPGAPLCTPHDALVETDAYSGHKIHCEKRVQELASPWAILRLAGMIDGRLRQRDPEQARMAFSLAPESPVEYVHTSDAATAIANVLERPEAHGAIHLIGGGKACQVTTLQLTRTMVGAIGLQVTAEDMGDAPASAPWLDTTESQRLLSFQKHTAEDFRQESLARFRFIRPLVRPLSPLILRALKLYLRASNPRRREADREREGRRAGSDDRGGTIPMHVTLQSMDPELRAMGLVARALFRPSKGFMRLARRMDARMRGADLPGAECEQRWVDSLDAGVRVRVRTYRPPGRSGGPPLPGVLFLHGGGYAMGTPEQFAATCRTLLETRDCVIVAPDYRKSLDAPYPAALHDCYGALLWLKENAVALGVREDQLFVMGASAGGGLTAAVSLLARDRGDVRIAHQIPLYPMIDHRMVTDSARDNDAPVWGSKHNRLAWDLYLGGLAGGDVPKYASPALETDLTDLPPTTTFVGELDPFRDETEAYVEGLRAAGVAVAHRRYAGCYHGFDIVRPGARVSREANGFLRERFAAAVDHDFAKQP